MSQFATLAAQGQLRAKELSNYAPVSTEPQPHHHVTIWSYTHVRGGWVKIHSLRFASADAAEIFLANFKIHNLHESATILFNAPYMLVYQMPGYRPIDKIEVVACDGCNHD